ncbi:LysE family transporter [Pullulanibacillus sp. KACC 23026]|uniref:LysE family transporter n=1 Tax=Pullulanibacillus sp. KACC 23026 TaxID=3028315 RepID=UPI0023AF9525|nr:LysE family transporter [Pullulanibacillus sp. KACC 23026]WEG10923.1 LysE family transporter [Pullulanibacillus sp. KACC 23026]
MGILLSYFLLGLSLAAPIGPLNAAQIDRGLKEGFLSAWLLGIGANVADILYMLIVYFGLFHFINIPFVKVFLWGFGAFILIYTGIEGLKGWNHQTTKSLTRGKESLIKSFFTGFIMSLSNPLTILFWLGIYGSVLAETASKFGTRELLACSTFIFLGLFMWDISMAAISSSFRVFLTSRLIQAISLVSSLSLIGFGCFFGYQGMLLLLN